MNANPRGNTVSVPLMALGLGALAIGFSPIWVRVSPVGPTATAFYRVALALPFFLAVFGAERGWRGRGVRRPITRTVSLWWLGLPGLFLAGDLCMWHWALQFTTVSNATLLGNLAPVYVTAVAWRFFGERVNRSFLAGLLLAFAGTAVLMGQSFQLSLANVTGDAVAMLAAGLYAAYQLSVKRLRGHFGTTAIMTATCAGASALLLPATLLSGDSLVWPELHWFAGLAPLLGLALLSQVAGQGLITYALRHLPVSFSSVTLLMQPLVAASAAWILLGEKLGLFAILGGAVVLSGIFMAQRATFAGSRQHDEEG